MQLGFLIPFFLEKKLKKVFLSPYIFTFVMIIFIYLLQTYPISDRPVDLERWMTNLPDEIANRPIFELKIPGIFLFICLLFTFKTFMFLIYTIKSIFLIKNLLFHGEKVIFLKENLLFRIFLSVFIWNFIFLFNFSTF